MDSFAVLEPKADGFRNYLKGEYAVSARGAAPRSGSTHDADRTRDDGSRRRNAGFERQLRADRRTASLPTVPAPSPTTSS